MTESASGCMPLSGLLAKLFGPSAPSQGPHLPTVALNKKFVSSPEGNFFRVLRQVVDTRGHVLAQVSLLQLLYFPGNNQSNAGRATWMNKVARRSLDFVICHPHTLVPFVAIELDEASHTRPARQQRDEEVEQILHAAGLPLLHVLTSRNYDLRHLDEVITPHLRP